MFGMVAAEWLIGSSEVKDPVLGPFRVDTSRVPEATELERLFADQRFGVVSVHKDGGSLPRTSVCRVADPDRISDTKVDRGFLLDATRLRFALESGATVHLRGWNPSEQLASILQVMQRCLEARVQPVIFLGGLSGLGWHFDVAAVLTVQIHSSKTWEVARPSVEFNNPLAGLGDGTRGPNLWSGTVDRGSGFAVDQGLWHRVTSSETESLSLNFAVSRPSVQSFLAWAGHGLSADETMRRPLLLEDHLLASEAGNLADCFTEEATKAFRIKELASLPSSKRDRFSLASRQQERQSQLSFSAPGGMHLVDAGDSDFEIIADHQFWKLPRLLWEPLLQMAAGDDYLADLSGSDERSVSLRRVRELGLISSKPVS